MKKLQKFGKGILILLTLACLYSLSFTILPWFVNADGEDVTPPVLVSYEFNKNTIDTGSGHDTVIVTAVITDDLTGVETGGSSSPTQFLMVPVSGIGHSSVAVFSEVGGEVDTYSAELNFPHGSAIGEWHIIGFLLVDKIGNMVNLSTEDVEDKAIGSARITNNATEHDITPPELISFVIVEETIDTNDSEDTITINVEITDDMTGVETGGSSSPTQVRMVSDLNSGQDVVAIFSQVEGEGNEDKYSAVLTFPKGSAKGDWSVTSLLLIDKIGNSTTLELQEIENVAGIGNATITNLAEVEDVTPPEMINFTITPAIFDTTQGDVELTLQIELTDDIAGVAVAPDNQTGASSVTQMRIKPLIGTQSRDFATIYLEEGNYLEGVYTSTITIPQYSKVGIWEVEYVLVSDYIYNHKTYSKQEIIQKDLGNVFLVNTAISDEVLIEADWSINSENIEVNFPAGTVVSKAQGGGFGFYRMINQSYNIEEFEDFENLIQVINTEDNKEVDVENIFSTVFECHEDEECVETEISDDGFEGNPIVILRAGIPRVNLTFSQPIEITIKNLQQYEGYVLAVQTFQEGGNSWSSEKFCTVLDGRCTFNTSHASFFGVSAYSNPTSQNNPELQNTAERLVVQETHLPQTGSAVIFITTTALLTLMSYAILKKYKTLS